MSEEPKHAPGGEQGTEQTDLFGAVTDAELQQALVQTQVHVQLDMDRARALAAELDRRGLPVAGLGPPSDVYTGPPDARQASEIKPTRFRPRYRALTPEELTLHDQIKEEAVVLEGLYNHLVFGRYHALAMIALEESVFWAVKGLTE